MGLYDRSYMHRSGGGFVFIYHADLIGIGYGRMEIKLTCDLRKGIILVVNGI